MLTNILIDRYQSILIDIFKAYRNILIKNNHYDKYLKIIKHEIKLITGAFGTLINQRKNTFQSIFEYDSESILYAVDKELFKYIKTIFESVSVLLNKK